MCGIIALDQETGAFGVGVIAANFGGRDSTIGTSSFKTSMKFFQLKISLKPLNKTRKKQLQHYKIRVTYLTSLSGIDENPYLVSVQKEWWSNVGKTNVAFIILAIATMSLICNLMENSFISHNINWRKQGVEK